MRACVYTCAYVCMGRGEGGGEEVLGVVECICMRGWGGGVNMHPCFTPVSISKSSCQVLSASDLRPEGAVE